MKVIGNILIDFLDQSLVESFMSHIINKALFLIIFDWKQDTVSWHVLAIPYPDNISHF